MRKIICETGEIVNSYSEYLQTDHWKHKRSVVRKKYKNICLECGSDFDLQVHHITYENIGREKIKELVLLCGPCHTAEHKRDVKKYEVGKNKPYSKNKVVNAEPKKVEKIKIKKVPTKKNELQKIVVPNNKISENVKFKTIDIACEQYGEFPSTVSKKAFLRAKNRKVILKTGNKIEATKKELLIFNSNNILIETIPFKKENK